MTARKKGGKVAVKSSGAILVRFLASPLKTEFKPCVCITPRHCPRCFSGVQFFHRHILTPAPRVNVRWRPAGRRLSQHRALFGNPSLAYYGAIARASCGFFWHAGRVAASGAVQTTLTCISVWGSLSVLWGIAER